MDDAISRQAVLKLLSTMPPEEAITKAMLIQNVKYMSAAQPERKKGKWIEVDDAYNRIRGRCSACGWEAHMYEDDVVGMWFCPNCGADMRGEEDD